MLLMSLNNDRTTERYWIILNLKKSIIMNETTNNFVAGEDFRLAVGKNCRLSQFECQFKNEIINNKKVSVIVYLPFGNE